MTYYYCKSRKTTRSWPVIYDSSNSRRSLQYDSTTETLNSFDQQPQQQLNFCYYPEEYTSNFNFTNAGRTTTSSNCSGQWDKIEKLDTIVTDDNHNTIQHSMTTSVSEQNQTQLGSSSCSLSPNPIAILFLTLLLTSGATAVLCAAMMTNNWELVRWDADLLQKLANESQPDPITLEWMLDNRVSRIPLSINHGEF